MSSIPTKKKLSKENHKLYLVTHSILPTYSRVWKKASLVHYCKKLYGINFSDWINIHKGLFGPWKISPYTQTKVIKNEEPTQTNIPC